MPTRLNKNLPFLIIGSGLLIAFAIIALPVFANSPFDIEFPIPELGNCADKTACKSYCDNEEHLEVCQAFAAKHGLGATHEEVNKTLKELDEDGGPGGCANDAKNPTLSCKRYCDNSVHIEECVSYAEQHGLMEKGELKEAKKVVSALRRGVKLPPQCENAKSCKATCEDPKDLVTARACFEFGKEAGLLPEGVSVEQAEKAFSALESGKGPFKSFSEMRQCDNPPSDEIMQKCIDFALDAGFIPPEEAEIIKKTGGKGPGGCRGKDQCENYCETNQEECFKFAEEHNLVREEDKSRMKEGASQMQEALTKAPPEVKSCIKDAIPELEAILSGEKFPSPALRDKMRGCFENFFKNQAGSFGEDKDLGAPPGGERNVNGSSDTRRIPQFPPEVKKCLLEKFGEEFFTTFGKERPSPDVEAKMGECFQAIRGGNEKHEGESKDSGGGFGKDRPCPAMPTVNSCGEGEELMQKEVPGCGVYGRCVPKGGGGSATSLEKRQLPQGKPSADEYGKEYQKQFDQKFKEEFQNQYRQEMNRQIKEQTDRQTQEQYQKEYQKYQGGTGPGGVQYKTPETSRDIMPERGALPNFAPPPPSNYPSPSEGGSRPPDSVPSSGTAPPSPSGSDYHPPAPAPASFWFSPDSELLGNVYSAIKDLRNR